MISLRTELLKKADLAPKDGGGEGTRFWLARDLATIAVKAQDLPGWIDGPSKNYVEAKEEAELKVMYGWNGVLAQILVIWKAGDFTRWPIDRVPRVS